MRMQALFTEDCKATRIVLEDSKGLQQSGCTVIACEGFYLGNHETSMVILSTDWHALVGFAARLVAERSQELVLIVDSRCDVWKVELQGLVVQCFNTETKEQYKASTEAMESYNQKRGLIV